MALDPVDVVLGQIHAPAGAIHDRAGDHHATRHNLELAAHHIGDEQLVSGEIDCVSWLFATLPHVRIAILLVRLVLGACPLADSFFRRIAVPFTVPICERQILECCH